jgi:hypothetical protein
MSSNESSDWQQAQTRPDFRPERPAPPQPPASTGSSLQSHGTRLLATRPRLLQSRRPSHACRVQRIHPVAGQDMACPRAETALFFLCNVFFCCVFTPGEFGRKYPAWDGLAVFWRIFGILIFIIITFTILPSENEATHSMGHPHNRHAQVGLLYILYPHVSLTTVDPHQHFFYCTLATEQLLTRLAATALTYNPCPFLFSMFRHRAIRHVTLHVRSARDFSDTRGAGSSSGIYVLERKSFDKI